MRNLSLFEPHLFKPVLGDPLDAMFNRFIAPLRSEWENGALDMRIDGNIVQIDAASKKQKETKATAKYEDGVLTLQLPKKATTTSKRLQIQ